MDAINTLFTEFEVAFPNLYHRAYASDESLRLAKQLWLNSLRKYPARVILRAAQKAIESSDFIPTIKSVLAFCEDQRGALGLPTARAAYIECCMKPEPKAEQAWSHPAVYFAGRETGWFLLSTEPEAEVFPIFEHHYAQLCERALAGEKLDIVLPKALPAEIPVRLTTEERKARLAKLRQEVGL